MQQLNNIEKNYCYFLDLLLLFYFFSQLENQHMSHFFSNLFFEDGNAINQRYQK